MSDVFSMERPLGRSHGDAALLGALVLAVGLGLANLYSASYGYALALGRGASYFALRHALWLLPSIAAFIAIAAVPLALWRSLAGPAALLSIALLVLPFVPGLGIVKNGGIRWFGFGSLSFQPSELFKPVLVLYLAHILAKKEERLNDIMRGVLPPLALMGLGIVIVQLQNDFSTALLLAAIALCMFWIAKVPLVFFIASGSVALPLVALSVLTSDYRLKRVVGFLAPRFDPADLSYQVSGSIKAIRAGGFWGRGIGQGSLKLRSIPAVQSDFIFSAWAEETGFIGVLLFCALWAFILYRAIRISFGAADSYRSYLAFGMAFYLGLQTLINIMVAAGAVPATGIPLPYFSSGGSSLLSVTIAAGFIFAVSREQRAEARNEGRPSHD